MTDRRLKLYRFTRCRRGGDAGQALLELALSMPLLFLLLLGAVEFGRFAYLAIEISSAAKAAAQYGAQNSITAADISGMQLVASKDAPEVGSSCTNFTTTIAQPASCVCVTSGSSAAATCGTTCAAGSYLVQNLTVTTSAQCKPLTHVPGFATLTLSGHAVQEVLR